MMSDRQRSKDPCNQKIPGPADGTGQARPERPFRLELAVVLATLAVAHLVMLWRLVPLPTCDLSFYTEPAWQLAQSGRLCGPGSQHLDLTYVQGIYFYPPGYPLVLAAWLKAFGLSVLSLLAFTHLLHFVFLACLWVILRLRFGCDRWAAALAVISVFPFFGHGRPDLTALVFASLAWLALPKHAWLAAFLLGWSVLVSPGYGISSSFVLGSHLLLVKRQWRLLAILWGGGALTFAGVVAVVLTWQNAWLLGPVQFIVNSLERGRELNALPSLTSRYAVVFCLIPLGLLTVLPLVVIVVRAVRRHELFTTQLGHAAVSYILGIVPWFLLNKAPLLTQHHYSFLARPVFHGALASSGGFMRRLGLAVLLLYTAFNFYLQKDEFLYMIGDLRGGYRAVARLAIPAAEKLAVDSCYLPLLYSNGQTLNYEIVKVNYWVRYRDRSARLLGQVPDVQQCPAEPGAMVVSACTLQRMGLPDPERYELRLGQWPFRRASFLGVSFPIPADPLEPYVFVRRETPRSPEGR